MNSYCYLSIGISFNGYWFLTYFMERELFKWNTNTIISLHKEISTFQV